MKTKQPRFDNGRYGAKGFSWKVKLLLASIIAWIGYGAYLYASSPIIFVNNASRGAQSVTEGVAGAIIRTVEAKDRLDKVISEDKALIISLKVEIAEKLRALEGAGVKSTKDTVFITFDPNSSERGKCSKSGGKMNLLCVSLGEMQTKVPTLIEMYRKETGKTLSEREAFDMALDTEKMMAFIPDVLVNQVGSCNAWTACTNNKAWFQERIDKVRALEAEIIRFENVK